jgi:PadR family transcriptional regulator, regulatory protein PadR
VSKDRIELLQGTLDILILKVLSAGPMHGYGVAQRIQQVSQDVLRIEEGSLYPSLYRMEQRGWISSKWGLSENNRRAKYYALTKLGRKQLQTGASNWVTLSEAISRVMRTA